MRLTFLGTGTSFGIPVIGCECATCTSDDPRDHRTRNGALLTLAGGRLLVDAPPELRLQLVRERVSSVDGVWITHGHADHLHGIDDLRVFTGQNRPPLPAYVPEEYEAELRVRFSYIFNPSIQVPQGTTKPDVRLVTVRRGEPIEILGAVFQPLAVPHGDVPVYGFRVDGLGYITDGKWLPPEVFDALVGVEVLVINALWYGSPHPTHFNVEEAVAAAQALGARRTYLIHMTHRLRHADLLERLPLGIEPAFDGLSVEI